MRETGTPIWVGEFGPVYTGDPERDEMRYQVLADQLEHLRASRRRLVAVDLQGRRPPGPGAPSLAESPYLQRFGDLIAKKARLGVDSWGSTDAELPELFEPLHALIAREFPAWSPYPWNARSSTDDLVRHLLLAQAMLPEYAERFRGLDDDELDALADSFRLASASRARGWPTCSCPLAPAFARLTLSR